MPLQTKCDLPISESSPLIVGLSVQIIFDMVQMSQRVLLSPSSCKSDFNTIQCKARLKKALLKCKNKYFWCVYRQLRTLPTSGYSNQWLSFDDFQLHGGKHRRVFMPAWLHSHWT